jgi:ABC-2 type transport system permease protein
MRLWKSWVVAQKDFAVFRKNKYIFYSLIAMPLLFGIIIPLGLLLGLPFNTLPPAEAQLQLTMILNLITMYFVILAVTLPTVIASYSFVGEKIEKSLEPLLATPTTDSELLFGKSLSAFLPCIGATYIGAAIFLVICDAWSLSNFGTLILPNANFAVTMGLLTPLSCILSVEANIIISSKVNDVRAAQQLGGFVILPIILVIILGDTINFLPPEQLALAISGVVAAVDVAFFYLSKATFKREEILTKWK